MRPSSIRARLTLTLTLTTAILMLLVCGGLIAYTRHLAVRNADRLLQATATEIGTELGDGEQHYGPLEVIQENQSRLRANNLTITILDSQGRVLQKSDANAPAVPTPNKSWRIAMVRFRGYTILIGLPWAKMAAALNSEAMTLLGLALFVTMLSACTSCWLVGRTLSPIQRLSRQAKTASAASLKLRLSASSQDTEIVELVATLNELLERVAQAALNKSQFYAAASHELRTPLHVLAGSLEVALNPERSREEYRDVVRVADGQARQLTALVRDLLFLNQLDFMSAPPANETVDLADVICYTLTLFQPLIDRKGLQVRTDLLPYGGWEAPPAHVEMLVRNLIENAAKYTPGSGSIDVGLTCVPEGVELIIRNDCPTLPRLDCNQLCEPFYRPDPSRNILSGGNGLGLAICKAIANANGWTLTLTHDDAGFCVRVRFASLRRL